MKSATQKLADLRARRAALIAEEKALLDARLGEIAVIVDRAGGGVLTDEIIVGTIRQAVEGSDADRARLAEIGGTFLRPRSRKNAGESRPSDRPAGAPAIASADVADAAQDAAIARQDSAKNGEGQVANG